MTENHAPYKCNILMFFRKLPKKAFTIIIICKFILFFDLTRGHSAKTA